MLILLMIAVGGALGALARYGIALGIHSFMPRTFPYGTLFVNVTGAFIMGFLSVMLLERLPGNGALRGLFLVGFLGAYTTFSTFSFETLMLLENGELLRAFLNISLSVVLCLAAVWGGVLLGRGA